MLNRLRVIILILITSFFSDKVTVWKSRPTILGRMRLFCMHKIIVKILVSRLVMIMFGDVVRIVLNSFHTFNKSRSKS